MSENADSKPKKTRTRAPHSRNGCLTCKIRHVKCDETKPACKKCVKAGWNCEGYASKTAIKNRRSRTPKQLIPKPSRSISPSSSVSSAPFPQNEFNNQQECLYFKSFCDQTAVQLSGFLDSTLWENIILPACQMEPPLRHAAVAIGAVNFQGTNDFDSQTEHMRREFAYGEYSKAIEKMWQTTSEGTHSIRTTLIACLLFACFELSNNYPTSAAAQIRSGTQIIEECRLEHSKKTLIEIEIIQAFNRLQLQATSYLSSGICASPNPYRDYDPTGLPLMPVAFSNVQESRHHLDIILQSMTRSMTTTVTTDGLKSPSTALKIMLNHQTRYLPDDEELFFAHTMILNNFERWEESFLPVWQMAHESASRQQLLEVATIRLRFLNAYLSQHIFAGDGCVYYGRFTSECAEVIDLAKLIATHWTSNTDIDGSLDEQITLPLATIGWRFRDRYLRREVLKLISTPRSVGIWEGGINDLRKFLEWFRELEEDGLPDDVEFVPEERVVLDVNWDINSKTRITTLTCLQPVIDVPGVLLTRELVINWSHD